MSDLADSINAILDLVARDQSDPISLIQNGVCQLVSILSFSPGMILMGIIFLLISCGWSTSILSAPMRKVLAHHSHRGGMSTVVVLSTLFYFLCAGIPVSAQYLVNGQVFTDALAILDAPAPKRYAQTSQSLRHGPTLMSSFQYISRRQRHPHCYRRR